MPQFIAECTNLPTHQTFQSPEASLQYSRTSSSFPTFEATISARLFFKNQNGPDRKTYVTFHEDVFFILEICLTLRFSGPTVDGQNLANQLISATHIPDIPRLNDSFQPYLNICARTERVYVFSRYTSNHP